MRKLNKTTRKIAIIPDPTKNTDSIRFKIDIEKKFYDMSVETFSCNSAEYCCFNGVLISIGTGGARVLKTPSLCSDNQWELIKQGEVPEEFWAEPGTYWE